MRVVVARLKVITRIIRIRTTKEDDHHELSNDFIYNLNKSHSFGSSLLKKSSYQVLIFILRVSCALIFCTYITPILYLYVHLYYYIQYMRV